MAPCRPMWHVFYLSVLSVLIFRRSDEFLTFLIGVIPPNIAEAFTESSTPYWGPDLDCELLGDIPTTDFATLPSNSHNASKTSTTPSPIVYLKRFYKRFSDRVTPGHIAYINDPLRTFSILEPGRRGGCQDNVRASVIDSAKQRKCLLAINAGFFWASTGGCYGNVVSDGRFVQTEKDERYQNAHFGIRSDGSFVFGYLTKEDIANETNPFTQLVTGVGWIVRDGKLNIEETKQIECNDTAINVYSINRLFNSISARTAIASDRHGRLMIVQIDGRTDLTGVTLPEFAEFLIKHGAVNAVNLDGGGSSTLVYKGVVINYPTDVCVESDFTCSRPVAHIACVHEPNCSSSADCRNEHARCIAGECHYDCAIDDNHCHHKESIAELQHKTPHDWVDLNYFNPN
ncbi:N-acetylglucosamine-1-phosphodiester alpha-N-acetylglucosaminidase-like [Amphiura filiformis]|uniref:N-acetylglucosamine-1-phosphodiester alpha-N-acetylglucosaminidase-like n=1 Tax=Amphiura filiformis TaxID=82378 RepID=UPI003B216ADE